MPKLDWTQRESVRADLRRKVRRLLAKYGYPPDLSEDATQLVLKQAELSTSNGSWYSTRTHVVLDGIVHGARTLATRVPERNNPPRFYHPMLKPLSIPSDDPTRPPASDRLPPGSSIAGRFNRHRRFSFGGGGR